MFYICYSKWDFIYEKIVQKKWKLIIGVAVSTLSIIPLIAVSAVACSQPNIQKSKVHYNNQEIANALQNYLAKNKSFLNGSAAINQQNNLFLEPIYYINWSGILNYVKSELHQKPKVVFGGNNYNLNLIGIKKLNSSNYNHENGTISFTLTYAGVPASGFLMLTNLQTLKPIQNPSIKINVQPQNVQAGSNLPAQINVSAVGQYNLGASLSYQWYFKQNNSATPILLSNNNVYSGANTSSLNIASTNTQTIGAYYVVISFPFANSLTSASANLSLINNPSEQINNLFHTTTSDGKQQVSPTLSSNIANDVNGIDGSKQYIAPNGQINDEGIGKIKEAIKKTLATNPNTAGYQNLPIKVVTSSVNSKNEININYQIGDIKGEINNVNIGLNQSQVGQKLTTWLNNPENLQKSLGEYFKANPNQILQTINGRYTTGDYQWLGGQTPNVKIVPQSLKVIKMDPVIWSSANTNGNNGQWVKVDSNIIKQYQVWINSLSQSQINGFIHLPSGNSLISLPSYNALEVSLTTTSPGYMFQTSSWNGSNVVNNAKAFEVSKGTVINTLLPFSGNIIGTYLQANQIQNVNLNLLNGTFTGTPENNPQTKISWSSSFYGPHNFPEGTFIFNYSNTNYYSQMANYSFKYQNKYFYPATIGYYGPYTNGNTFEMQSPTENPFTQGVISSNAFKAQANSIQNTPMTKYGGVINYPNNTITSITVPGLPWCYTNK